mgnify:CR=1 FL=1
MRLLYASALVALLVSSSGCRGLFSREPAESVEQLQKLSKERLVQLEGSLQTQGLREPVEILRDKWGVAHIYAKNTHDLFFAQGFTAAQDRLYQMEIWRRTGAGELAEVFGAECVERDRIARLVS